MYKSKLVDILKVLNRQEKEALKKWVKSPVHNQHQKSQELILLLQSKRSLTARTCNRHQVYSKLYPREKYKDSTLKHLMNYCVQLLEDFIEFLMQKKNTFYSKKMLIEFYNSHNLNKYAQQHIQKVQKAAQKQSLQDNTYYYNQYQLEKVVFDYQNIATRTPQTNLQGVLDNHFLAFVLETLHYACEAITLQRLYKTAYHVPQLESILGEIEGGLFADIPAVQLYFYSYQSLSCPEVESHFHTLKSLLVKHHEVLPAPQIKSIYLTAINYCIQKLNNGIEKYVRLVFELYQYGLRHSILIENNHLSRFAYKNISTAAIRLKEYDWTNQFIKDYTPFLEEIYQENYSDFAKAKLLFAQKEYDSCILLLAKVEFDDLFLNMNAKSMLLKIYYERQYFDALDAFLTSFRRFLQRKTIVAYQRTIYTNLITLTEKLIAIPSHEKEKLADLRLEIETTSPLTEKPWLLEQFDRL